MHQHTPKHPRSKGREPFGMQSADHRAASSGCLGDRACAQADA